MPSAGANFGIHGTSFNTAQPLDGVNIVLGAIIRERWRLQALDLQAFAYSNIYQTDPVTGAFGSHIVSPNNDGYYLFGQNMASRRRPTPTTTTATAARARSTSWTRPEHVVATTARPTVISTRGLAYLNGKLYADAPYDSNIYIYDARPWHSWARSTPVRRTRLVVGLAGDPGRGVLWAVAPDRRHHRHSRRDRPDDRGDLKGGRDNNQGRYEQDIAYANGELIVSEVNGRRRGRQQLLDEYNPDTLGFIQRVSPPYQ